MRRMRERHAEMSANGGVPVHRSRGWMNVFALPSYVANRMGAGGDRGRGTEVGGDGHGQVWSRRSFSEFASVAPTQQEEDEEWRNMSLCESRSSGGFGAVALGFADLLLLLLL